LHDVRLPADALTVADLNDMPRVPQPVIIAACLCTGLGLGLAFPQNQVVLAIAQSGTWFPRTIVTLATAIVFVLMSAALARTLLIARTRHAVSRRFWSRSTS
jgi:hypothetical protein